jgi:hypothetical protein
MRRLPGCASTVSSSGPTPDAWASRCRTVAPGGPADSSSETSPRDTAISTPSAVTNLVTDAHGIGSSGPVRAISPVPSRTATAACSTGHSRTASNARMTPTLTARRPA